MRASAAALGLFAFLGACAPRMATTHYERWAAQDAQRRTEAAEEEKAASAGKPASQPGTPSAPPATPAGSMVTPERPEPASPTPPIGTATKSRALQPADDDAIY